MGDTTLILTTIPFVLVALLLVVIAMRSAGRARRVKRWPTVPGRVLHSGAESRRVRSQSGYTTMYYPQVVYEYSVNGQRYHGTRVSAGTEVGRGRGRNVQAQTQKKYPAGAVVQVYYNPTNPQETALEAKSPNVIVLVFVVLVIFVILGATMFFTTSMLGSVDDLISNLPSQ
jgi:hypothetical protein